MAEEFKTLLKVEGDASGAKRAAEEAVKAVESLDEKSAAASSAMAETGQDVASGMKEGEAAATIASESADGAALAFQTAGKEAAQMRLLLSRISPEAARLFDVFKHGQDIMGQVFLGSANHIIAAAAAVAMLTAAWNEAAEAAQRARTEMEKVTALQENIRSRERARVEDVSEVMARAGKVGETVTGAATAIEKRMAGQGFAPETIRKVLPFAVDEAGQQVLTDEEIANLAAMETYGKGQLEFGKPKEMASRLRRAQRAAQRDPALVAKWRDAIRQKQERQTEAASRMVDADVAKILHEGPEDVPQDQLKEAIADIESVVTTGRVSGEELSLFWSGSDRLIWARRQRDAARRAQALGLIGNQEAITASGITPGQAMGASVREEAQDLAGGARSAMGNIPAYRIGAAVAGAAASAAGSVVNYITNHYNHGTINNGRPSTQPVQRGVAP